MAGKWYASLQNLLPRAKLTVITSTPVVSVAAGKAYKYQVAATGTPKPTFSLGVAPAGMVIDANSGLITWTAAETVGKSFPVKVLATQSVDIGWAVPASQEFSVTITKDDDDDDDGRSGGSGGGGGCFIESTLAGGISGCGSDQLHWGLLGGLIAGVLALIAANHAKIRR
jgi:hypothetical protein